MAPKNYRRFEEFWQDFVSEFTTDRLSSWNPEIWAAENLHANIWRERMALVFMNLAERTPNYELQIGHGIHALTATKVPQMQEVASKGDIPRQWANTMADALGDDDGNPILQLPINKEGRTMARQFEKLGLEAKSEMKVYVPQSSVEGNLDLLVRRGNQPILMTDIKPMGKYLGDDPHAGLYFSPQRIREFWDMAGRWKGSGLSRKRMEKDVREWMWSTMKKVPGEEIGGTVVRPTVTTSDLFPKGVVPEDVKWGPLASGVLRYGLQTLVAYPSGVQAKMGSMPAVLIGTYNNEVLANLERKGITSAHSKKAVREQWGLRQQISTSVERAVSEMPVGATPVSVGGDLPWQYAEKHENFIREVMGGDEFRRVAGLAWKGAQEIRKVGANLTFGVFPKRVAQAQSFLDPATHDEALQEFLKRTGAAPPASKRP